MICNLMKAFTVTVIFSVLSRAVSTYNPFYPKTIFPENIFFQRVNPPNVAGPVPGISLIAALGSIKEIMTLVCETVDGLCQQQIGISPSSRRFERLGQETEQQPELIELGEAPPRCGRGVVRGDKCICPLDYFGTACEHPRNFHCRLSRVLPSACSLSDNTYNPKLDGDPPCISYSVTKNGNVTLGFKLSCAMNRLHQKIKEEPKNHSFPYALQRLDSEERFALSELPQEEIMFRPYNWDRPFSDLQFVQRTLLSRDMLLGREEIYFSVPMTKILLSSAGYSRGGRFFAEVRINTKRYSNVPRATDCWKCVDRVFIEISV